MKVLITRPRSQSASFGAALQKAGFESVYFPVIEIRPLEDLSELDRALAEMEQYAWLVFTSVNAVEIVFERLKIHHRDTESAEKNNQNLSELRVSLVDSDVKIAAIGPKTAAALRVREIEPSLIPDEFVGEAILPGLGDLRGKQVLLPRAEIARKELPEAIRAAGGVAHDIAVYHTLPAAPDPTGLAALKAGVDVLTFTSPSTVDNFVEIVRQNGLDPLALPGNPKIVCIGPITAKAAHDAGFAVAASADEYTTEGMIKTILDLRF
jgi:uroporphyrinogen III methyltransferase/synthase